MHKPAEIKKELHPRNRHSCGYDFNALIKADSALKEFVTPNKYGNVSINFFDPKAVKALNAALLKLYYKIEWWDIPSSALTPPIPSRADYIHYVAELINYQRARCLDIGVGANCIYPIIGRAEYGWDFVGSDIEQHSIDSAQKIVDNNSLLQEHIELRKQNNPANIFEGIIKEGDYFDLTICNPPFHDSAQSAQKAAARKLKGVGGTKSKKVLNFGGQSNELWCEGGERLFIERMIGESTLFASQCGWFTTLVSSEDNLKALKIAIRNARAKEVKVIDMHQGNKHSRVLAWRFR